MAGKRNATSELNHDNWNNEEEPEDAGTFTTASPEELQKRVVKTAKRRIAPGSEVIFFFYLSISIIILIYYLINKLININFYFYLTTWNE